MADFEIPAGKLTDEEIVKYCMDTFQEFPGTRPTGPDGFGITLGEYQEYFESVIPLARELIKVGQEVPAVPMVTCQVFSGCRCSICGRFFGDCDDVCDGGHQIGHQYSMPKRR